MEVITLKERYNDYKTLHPKARIFDVATALNVSEMEVLTISNVERITYLGDNFKAILKELSPLGKVMALTRNEHAVHEVKGLYDNVSFMDKAPMGIAHNDLIDMRYFISNWAHVYAVVFESGNRTMHSIQIFDKYGDAVHKIYATPESNLEAYEALVQKYIQENQDKLPEVITKSISTNTSSNLKKEGLDVGAFQTEWLNMKDTHDFFGMLKKYNLTRQEAFELAPEGAAYRVDKQAIVQVLEAMAAQQIPIMIFLGNEACLQIYAGLIHKVVQMNDWYNVLDPNFNLHLQLSSIDEAWIVKKYTSDGIVTSLELFDNKGQQILYCFGNRKPGIPELEDWRKVVKKLQKLV